MLGGNVAEVMHFKQKCMSVDEAVNPQVAGTPQNVVFLTFIHK